MSRRIADSSSSEIRFSSRKTSSSMNSSSWDAACFDGGGCDGGAAGRLRELDLFIGELGSEKRVRWSGVRVRV